MPGEESPGAGGPDGEALRKLRALAEVLAYFAASRNYGYVDILSNALDPAVALETVYNLVRDFKSSCIDREHRPCEGAEAGDVDARCPRVSARELDEAVRAFAELTERLYQEGRTSDLIVVYRRLAAEAIGRSLGLMVRCGGEGAAGPQGSQPSQA